MACEGPAPPERIVLIVIDTLRRDALGHHGGKIATPRLDALARRGVAIPDYRSAYHQTTASMAALFTGRTPSIETGDPARPLAWTMDSWCGLARFGGPGASCVPASLPTLAAQLRDAGYWTIGVLSNPLLHEPSGFGRGFDDVVEVGARPPPERPAWDARTWRQVNAAASDAIGRRRDDRFFLYVHYMDVHDYDDRKDAYENGVRAADEGVGALLDVLEAGGLLRGAVVIVTSDHGEELGESHPPPPRRARYHHYGNPSFEELLAVPLLVAPADAVRGAPPRRTVELHDWILRLAGSGSAPSAQDVRRGETFVSEASYRTYLEDDWKVAFARASGEVLLFDLRRDPREQRDLSAERPDLVAKYRQRVDELTRALAAADTGRRTMTQQERALLEALGYLHPPGAEGP